MDNEYVILYCVKLIDGSEVYFNINTFHLYFEKDSMCYEFDKGYQTIAVFPVNQIKSITPVRVSADQVEFDTI